MSLSKHEWNIAVLLGCLAGTGLVFLLWMLVEALAQLNREAWPLGWIVAAMVTTLLGNLVWNVCQSVRHDLVFQSLQRAAKRDKKARREKEAAV